MQVDPRPHTSTSRQGPAQENVMAAQARIQLQPSVPVFDIASPELLNVRSAIEAGRRPLDKNRRAMVFSLNQSLKEKVPGYNHDNARSVADQIVSLFPKSFQDTIENPKNKIGSDSLRRNLIVALDNASRDAAKQAKATAVNPPIPHAFGCFNWNPAIPDTEDELMQIQTEMQNEFRTKLPAAWNLEAIREQMTVTYPLQRQDLNEGISRTRLKKGQQPANQPMPMQEVRRKWPFLFTSQGMDVHFKLLTNVSYKDRQSSWLDENCRDIIRMLSTKGNDFQKIASLLEKAKNRESCTHPEMRALLIMLTTFFQDDSTLLFYRGEVCNL